jgi:hypothetical protein
VHVQLPPVRSHELRDRLLVARAASREQFRCLIGLSLLGALAALATGTARRGEAPAGRPVDPIAAI